MVVRHREKPSILEQMAGHLRLTYLSDLRRLTPAQQQQLQGMVESMAAETVPLRQWNEALHYLFGAVEADDAGAARQQLLSLLEQGSAENGSA